MEARCNRIQPLLRLRVNATKMFVTSIRLGHRSHPGTTKDGHACKARSLDRALRGYSSEPKFVRRSLVDALFSAVRTADSNYCNQVITFKTILQVDESQAIERQWHQRLS